MKKVLVLLLCMLIALTLIVGCAKTNSETSAEATKAPAEPTEAPAPKEEEPEVAREAELNIMMSFPQYMEQWEKYVDQFEKKMLNEKNIKLTVNLEMPASDQYESVLQARLTGDDAPDLYTIHANNISTYNDGGYLADLSSEALAGKIYDNIKETVIIDGKLLALPIESQAWGVLYNKSIFKECNITPPDTLDQLKDVCAVLKDNGYTPFTLAFQEQWVPQLMTALSLGGKVTGDVPDWLSRMYEDKGSYEEMRDIFGVIDVIMQNGTDRAMESGYESGCADFANGKAAIYVQGTWAAGTILGVNPDIKIGVFALPVNNNVECTRVNLSTSTTLAVYPNSEELELALAFANYVLDDNDSSELFQACVFNPMASCHTYEVSSWVDEASQYVAKGRAYKDLVLPNAVTDEQGKLLQEYYVGSVTQDMFITRLDKAFQEANTLD